MSIVQWWVANATRIWALVLDHLLLALPAIALAVLISVPVGYYAAAHPRSGELLSVAVAMLYAIPALPLLIVIPALSGLPLRSPATLISALTLYAVALMVRSATDGFRSVDPGVRAAAQASGYSRAGLFWSVDLPLAAPVLFAGARVVAVSTISLVTIGALIGVSSLGSLLTDGFQRGILASVLAGVLGTVLLALLVDACLVLLGRLSSPWMRRRR